MPQTIIIISHKKPKPQAERNTKNKKAPNGYTTPTLFESELLGGALSFLTLSGTVSVDKTG